MKKGNFANKRVTARTRFGGIDIVPQEEADYMDVSPKQVVSVATAMIPFLENDDANRALMGSNMQRQAVPLLITDAPLLVLGWNIKQLRFWCCHCSKKQWIVDCVTAEEIKIKTEDGQKDKYKLLKFKRSNQGTCINQRPIVSKGDYVKTGDVIADGPSTDMGEIALGRNCLIGFMTWEGYNYEDAILINEKLSKGRFSNLYSH
jgi:DNA-directed RNA polymerase subunit beta